MTTHLTALALGNLIANGQSTYDGVFNISVSVIFMSDIDTEQEKLFRERYAEELRKKKQQSTYRYRDNNELVEERVKVNQQQQKTPGRRGEEIKQEEANLYFMEISTIGLQLLHFGFSNTMATMTLD